MSTAVRSADPQVPGHVRFRLSFDWPDDAVAVALRLGAGLEVLEPEWLRRSIVESAEAIVARYAETSVAALPG